MKERRTDTTAYYPNNAGWIRSFSVENSKQACIYSLQAVDNSGNCCLSAGRYVENCSLT